MNYYGNTTPPPQMYCPPDFVSPLERKELRHKFNIIGITLLCLEGSMSVIILLLRMIFINEPSYNEDGARILALRDVIIGMFVPALTSIAVFAVFCLLSRYDPRELFNVKNVHAGEVVRYVFIVLGFQHLSLLVNIVLIVVMQLSGYYVPSTASVTEHMPLTYGAEILVSVILAPIGEELIYRGIVLRCSAKISQRFAIFFSAFIFGIMHGNPYQFLLGFCIGIPMAVITIKSGSLIPAIICHMTNNLVGRISTVIEYFDKSRSVAVFYASIPVFLVAGMAVFIYELSSGRMKLPEYTSYHKKRTLPVILTSWSMITISVIYLYNIISSIKPLPEEMRGNLSSAAEEALKLLIL